MKYVLVLLALVASSANATEYVLETTIVTDWETVSHYVSQDEVQTKIGATVAYASVILSQQLGVIIDVTNTDIPQIASDDTIANHTNPSALVDSLHEYIIDKEYHLSSDITILLTSRRLSTGSNNYVGYANIESICSTRALVIVSLYDNGLDGQTLAHEIVHVLGAVHDGNEPCEATSSRGYLMSAAVHNGTDNLSQCSIDTVNATLARRGYCLLETSTVDPIDPVIPVYEPRSGGGSISIFTLLSLLLARRFTK